VTEGADVTGRKVPLGTMSVTSTELAVEPVLTDAGGDVLVRWEFDRDDRRYAAGVRFPTARAYRVRSDSQCTAWHMDETYDTVVEVEDSSWVAELRAVDPAAAAYFTMRHFMLYIDERGCYEVVAADWEMLPDTPLT
jgi:hypothetical protein